MSSSRCSRSQGRYAQGVTRNRPWRYQEGRFWAPSPPSSPETPCLLEGSGSPGLDSPFLYSSERMRGYGSYRERNTVWGFRNADSASLPGQVRQWLRGVTPPAPAGACTLRIAHNTRRTPARPYRTFGRYRPTLRPSQATGPSLPRSAESLPTLLGPVGTAFLWSQGRIPTAGYFPAPHRHRRYRTTEPRPNQLIGRGGAKEKPNILSDRYPSARLSAPTSASAIC